MYSVCHLKNKDRKNTSFKKITFFNENIRWLSIVYRNKIYFIYDCKLDCMIRFSDKEINKITIFKLDSYSLPIIKFVELTLIPDTEIFITSSKWNKIFSKITNLERY